MPKKDTKSKGPSPFPSAVQKGDLEAVQTLIQAGKKPDREAAGVAANACNRAFAKTRPTAKEGLFLRKVSKREAEQAVTEAEKYLKITEALLQAGAPAPEGELCVAAHRGNTRLALLLIQHGADVDYDPPMGTPLENAVESGDLEIIRALIQKGADIHHWGFKGSLLERAVSVGQPAVADALLAAGIDVNAQKDGGSTALLHAVTERKVEFVKKLLKAGANVNQKGDTICGDFGEPEVKEEGMFRTTHIPNPPFARRATPLIVAARRGYADVARILIEGGADLEATDQEGFTALAHATRSKDQELSKLLLEAGAKPLEHAEGSPEAAFMAAAREGDCARLESMLSKGLDVNLKFSTEEEMERTALICAAENGRADAVRLLLNSGAKPDLPCGKSWNEPHNRTALMHAAQAGHGAIIQQLLKAEASLTAKDGGMEGTGRAALHYAAEAGKAQAIRVLLKAGAKVNAKTKHGETALSLAAGNNHLEAIKVLLELGADPNLGSKDGCSPLYAAASNGAAEAVSLLLQAGAKPDQESDFSPMEAATTGGHSKVVELLLAAGASIVGTGKEDSALVNAALMGQTGIIRTLLKAGADPNKADDQGFTPLMGAVRSGNLEVVKILLVAGAEVNATNQERETALDMAYDGIKAARDQAKFLKMISQGEMDQETRSAIDLIKKSGNEDEITQALKAAGGKKGKELKLPKKPKAKVVEEESHEVELPDFGPAAAEPAYQKAIEEISKVCGDKPKPLSSEEGDELAGCVFFRVATEKLDEILENHQTAFLEKGCFLVRHERGYTSGKDKLAALPTRDWKEVLRAFQTNGCNCDVFTPDIIRWLEAEQKEQPFILTGAGFDWCEGKFTAPLKNPKKLAQKIYEFCPDIVDQGTGDVAQLASELKRQQKFFFWWD